MIGKSYELFLLCCNIFTQLYNIYDKKGGKEKMDFFLSSVKAEEDRQPQ